MVKNKKKNEHFRHQCRIREFSSPITWLMTLQFQQVFFPSSDYHKGKEENQELKLQLSYICRHLQAGHCSFYTPIFDI